MTDKLLNCPFCGGEAFEYYSGSQFEICEVVCKECGCRSKRKTEDEAIAAWNTRKPIDRIAEKLEEEVTEIGSRVCNNTKCNHECVNNAGMCDHGVLMGAIINAIREGVQNE